MVDDAADRERRQPAAAECAELPGRDPAAAVLRSARRPPPPTTARIGAVIGHEISHTFDYRRQQPSTPTGRVRNWWTPGRPRSTSSVATAKLAAQYDTYKPFPDLAVNGKQTLGGKHRRRRRHRRRLRRLSRLARRQAGAEQDGFTGDQQFFIAFAQNWASKTRDSRTAPAGPDRPPRARPVPRRHRAQHRRLVLRLRREARTNSISRPKSASASGEWAIWSLLVPAHGAAVVPRTMRRGATTVSVPAACCPSRRASARTTARSARRGNVLADGGEVDVGQPGEMAVVEADDGDLPGHRDAGAEEHVEDAGGALVVEGHDRGRPGAGRRAGRGRRRRRPARSGRRARPARTARDGAWRCGSPGAGRRRPAARPPSMWTISRWPIETRWSTAWRAPSSSAVRTTSTPAADGGSRRAIADDRQLRGEFLQPRHRCLRAEQDQRLAPVVEQGLGGPLLAAAGGHGAERELVPGRLGHRVQGLHQVGVERVGQAELHAEQAGAAAAQQPRPGIGPVPDLLRGLEDLLAGGRADALGAAHRDGDQRHRDARPGRHVGEGRPLRHRSSDFL